MARALTPSLIVVLFGCAPPKAVEPSTAAPPSDTAAPIEPATPIEAPSEPAVEPAAPAEPEQPPPPTAETPAAETPPPGFTAIPAKRKGGFPGVAFTEVRAFAFDLGVDGPPTCGLPLDPDGTLCKTVDKPGVVLSDAQTKLLLGMLAKKSTWGSGSSCFLPHHGFVFYDEAGTPVAELSVCFMCQMMVAVPSIPKAKRVEGDDTYGLNEKSTAQLRALCNELGLPKCDAKNPTEFGH